MRSNRILVSLCSRSNRLQISLQMNHQHVVIRVRDILSSVFYEKYELYSKCKRRWNKLNRVRSDTIILVKHTDGSLAMGRLIQASELI